MSGAGGDSKASVLSLWMQGMLLSWLKPYSLTVGTNPMDSIYSSAVSQNTPIVSTGKVQDSAGCIYDIVKISSLPLKSFQHHWDNIRSAK